MNEADAIVQAQQSIIQLLRALQLVRIICVDDDYHDKPTLEEVLVAVCTLEKDKIKELLPELESEIPEDEDVLKQKMRQLWETLDPSVKEERTSQILVHSRLNDTDEKEDDDADAAILSQLVPKERLLELSYAQWKDRKDQLLAENIERPALFLFDQNLTREGGGDNEGIKIIASVLSGDTSEKLICGLLTHTVDPKGELNAKEQLSKDYSVPIDRFLVISKQNLSKDPVLFAQLLKLVALSPDFTKFKKKTNEVIRASREGASSQVDAISIYDLDHIVFQESAEEGLWEPDMLFRLHALFHRLESRRLAHSDGELEVIAKRLRSVSHVPTYSAFSPVSSTWHIQQKELYEPQEHINRNHLPIELGDIFEKTETGSDKHYILLAQPCDLMVRKDGKRSPDIVYAPIAEIVHADYPPPNSEEIPYYKEQNNGRWYVKLKYINHVRLCLLDLCVFSGDGNAIINIDAEPLEDIRPTWQARHDVLLKEYRRIIRRIDLMMPNTQDSGDVKQYKHHLKAHLSSPLLGEGLFKGKLIEDGNERKIQYNCRRIGRLSRTRAFGILMAYTSCLSRPAYDRPFGVVPKN
mgnify:CR=1 FL=1